MSATIVDSYDLHQQDDDEWGLFSGAAYHTYEVNPEAPDVPEVEGEGEIPDSFYQAMREANAGDLEDFDA